MKNTKWWFQSRGVWGTNLAAGALGLVMAFWGRLKARKRLKFLPRALPSILLIILFVPTLGGCTALRPALSLLGLQEQVDLVEGKGLEGVAQAIDVYCSTETIFIPQRRERLAQINNMTHVGDMTALDCNADGAPDF